MGGPDLTATRPRFVQLATPTPEENGLTWLYALDAEGQVWELVGRAATPDSPLRWQPLEAEYWARGKSGATGKDPTPPEGAS